jgi:membrane protein DedA with SNARE-associated domain
VVRIRFARFTLFSFVGSFIWCALLALGGYYFGQNWEHLREIMRPFDIPIAIIIVLGLAYYIYRHVRRGASRKTQKG